MLFKNISSEEYEAIKQDYQSGMKLIDLEKKYNKPSSVLIGWFKRDGIFAPSFKRWTDSELEYLKLNYTTESWDVLLSYLNRWSKSDITTKAHKLGIPRSKYLWSQSDIDMLKKCYEKHIPGEEISKFLDNKFTPESIHTKAHKLGLRKKSKWTNEELCILKDSYSNIPLKELLNKLPGRDKDTIITMANGFHLKSFTYLKRQWTKELDDYILNHWEEMSDKEIANQIGKTFRSVKWRREKLGLIRVVEPGVYEYLDEYIRKRNRDWKKQSAKNCNYKCVITGGRFQDIHHLYGENLILSESLSNLELSAKNIIDYSETELQLILEEFIKVQSLYPLGVCLSHKIHKDFHDRYGYGDNTPDQFEEFIKLYQ